MRENAVGGGPVGAHFAGIVLDTGLVDFAGPMFAHAGPAAGVILVSQQEIEADFAGKGYGDFKAALTERLVATLEPIQKRYYELINNMPMLEGILTQGADEVRPLAAATLNRVKEVIGLG